jgi:phage FluMu gp28-like protein
VRNIASPRDLLLPFQERWCADASRFKLGLWSRQVGKDFSMGEEGVRDCIIAGRAGHKTTWLIVSPSERQSIESLSKWKEWAEAYKLAVDEQTDDRQAGAESLLNSSTIVFESGCRVIAVPGKPDTVRGYSANVCITEFAFIEDAEATWRAIIPSITNPLRGGEKKVRIISSANGCGNKFHDLWQKNHGVSRAHWSTHRVTIWDAVAEGLLTQAEVDELRDSIDDPEAWAQEFECEFIDASGVLLTYAMIGSCESHEASVVAPAGYWDTQDGPPVDIGIDFARKRDLSVAWSLEAVSDLKLTREILVMQDVPTNDQVEILRPRINRARRVCLDYTGPGVGLGDYLVAEHGEYNPDRHRYGKIELCTATNASNVDMFSKLRMDFENRSLRVPVDRTTREDLHSVYRQGTKTGVSYRAPHTKDGHADRCYALALARRAAAHDTGESFLFTPARTRRDNIIASRRQRMVTA